MAPPGMKPLESLEGVDEWDDDGHEEDEALEKINENIQELRGGHAIYAEENELFWPTVYHFRDKGLILTSIDSAGGDGCDMMEPIRINQIQGVLQKYNDEDKT